MSETYKFYVQMDGETYGPYSASAVRDLDLLDDILVTEESMNGQWLPASKFDFDDMVRKEIDAIPVSGHQSPVPIVNPVIGVVNQDGSVTNPNGWQPQHPINNNSINRTDSEDSSSPIGWCILSFIIPLVGWILYFNWRRTKPDKASAVCTWAWIGFVVNLFITFAGMM